MDSTKTTWILYSALCATLALASPLQIPLRQTGVSKPHQAGSHEYSASEHYTIQTRPGPCLQGYLCDHVTSLRMNQVWQLWGGLMADISIGTPPQKLEAYITLGSAPFYAINNTVKPAFYDREGWCVEVAMHCYNDQSSSTAKPTDVTASVTYNSIDLHGTIENDVVNIMGVDVHTDFLKVTSYDDHRFLDPDLLDTFLSLSRARVADWEPSNMQSPLRSLFSQGLVAYPLVAFDFLPFSSEEGEMEYMGTMTVGDFDKHYYGLRGFHDILTITAVQLDRVDRIVRDMSDWQVQGLSARYDNEVVDIREHTVVFEMSSSWIVLPQDFVQQFKQDYNITTADEQFMDCSAIGKLPDIVISLADYPDPPGPPLGGDITPQNIVVRPAEYVLEIDDFDDDGNLEKLCAIMIGENPVYGGDNEHEIITLGLSLLRNYYTTFDYNSESITLFRKISQLAS